MALEEAPATREGAAELLNIRYQMSVIGQTALTPLADTPAWKQVLGRGDVSATPKLCKQSRKALEGEAKGAFTTNLHSKLGLKERNGIKGP